MVLYLGYDPGGKGKNGVAALQVMPDRVELVASETLADAAQALSWLRTYAEEAEALGVDTLLAWSAKGGRACDNALRRKYGGNSIVAQNSLYSSMTLNGAIVARRLGLPAYESHPKLMLRVNGSSEVRSIYDDVVVRARADHEGDLSSRHGAPLWGTSSAGSPTSTLTSKMTLNLSRLTPDIRGSRASKLVLEEPTSGELEFRNLAHNSDLIAAWVTDYNTERPHSALGYQTPAGFALHLTTAIARPAARDEGFARRAIAQPAPKGVNQLPAPVAA